MNFDFDGAIFDMDGTLLDTMPYWRFTALEYILAHQMPIRPDMIARMYATSARKLLFEYAGQEGYVLNRPEVIRELEGFMNRHYLYDAKLKPNVPAFLEVLKSRGIRLCVATGAPREYARNGLRRLGILDYFDFVTDNYEFEYTKDQPGYFDRVVSRLGVDPQRCWVFEDALYAMKSAKATGVHICAIEDGAQIHDRAEIKNLADIYIRGYEELMTIQ